MKFLRAKSLTAKLSRQKRTVVSTVRKLLRSILLKAKSYKLTLIIAGIVFTSLLIIIAFYTIRFFKIKTYYIAYIGISQGEDFDRLHELALRKYIDELNADLNGVRLELKPFNNQENTELSKQIYEKISENKQFVAVIDNTWGRHLKTVASIINEKNIPVIAINADKETSDFGDNAIFIGHDNNVPRKIANFLSSEDVLNTKHVIFITEESYTLTKVFNEEFKNSSIETTQFKVSSEKVEPNELNNLLKNLDLELEKWQQRQEKPTVVINTHAKWGVEIIKYFDAKPLGATIIGGPYISNSNVKGFGRNNNNRLIILTNPSDVITNKIYHDLQEISLIDRKASEIENAQLFVKRCLDAASIIRGVFTDESIIHGALMDEPKETFKTTISSPDFINFFRGKLSGNVYIGKYDLYSFDRNLLLVDDKTFEEHSQGEKSSYPKQLNAQQQVIPNVYFGIEIINISNIDITNKTFHADFFYWLKYDKKYPEVVNYIHFRNEKNQDQAHEIPFDDISENTVYKLYKKSADFTIDVDFRKYPFDLQELQVELAVIIPSDHVLISFDHEGFNDSKKKAEEFSLNDWYREDFYVSVDNFIATSSRGGPGLISKQPRKFKTLTLRVPIRRHLTGPLVTLILPLIMIGLAAIATLYIKDSSFGFIGDACSAIFLSIVAYSIGFAELTPRSNILTTADMLFYFTFFTVLLMFLKVILFNSNMISERVRKLAGRRATLIGFFASIIYCLAVVLILIAGLI